MAKRDCVLVIGGSGFIGRVLVAQLQEAGCAVRVMSRQKRQGGGSVEYVQGDVTDRASIVAACDGIDVVYDLSMAFGETWSWYAVAKAGSHCSTTEWMVAVAPRST